jgi:glutathionylspermidine synthase
MTPELRAGRPLEDSRYDALVHRAVFDCCKWNLSVHDTPVLCRYPLLVSEATFTRLAHLAERLAAEALQAEQELSTRPELHTALALPPRLARALRGNTASSVPRFLRVDFHPTPDGFQITEANSDVAGGFIEGSGLSALFAKEVGGSTLGDPARALADALVLRQGRGARIGLLHLTRYTEDRQVVTYLARRFEEAGLHPVLFDASQLRPDLRARVGPQEQALDVVFRFFPGDWLVHLPRETGWAQLCSSPRVTNPVSTLLTQSKRFPLVWPELSAPLDTWRALMPESRSPDGTELGSHEWVLKPAFGHEGFGVMIPGQMEARQARALSRRVRRSPAQWVAQRRFELTAIETPDGPRHACLGIYVIDGRAAGAYARVSRGPLIDDTAQDAVVLLETAHDP